MRPAGTGESTLGIFIDAAAASLEWTIRGWRGGFTANASRPAHWGAHARERRRDLVVWDTLLLVAEATLGPYRDRALADWRRATLAHAFYLAVEEWGPPHRLRDPGAVLEASKRGWDSLVRRGWLQDDSARVVTQLSGRSGLPGAAHLGPDGVRLLVTARPDGLGRIGEGERVLRGFVGNPLRGGGAPGTTSPAPSARRPR